MEEVQKNNHSVFTEALIDIGTFDNVGMQILTAPGVATAAVVEKGYQSIAETFRKLLD
jgi:hypothetical protein